MSSSPDEFTSPLRIYHSTKDGNGDRRHVNLYLPAALVEEMERFMRSYTTYLSLHQFMLNCIFYGLEYLAQHGMAETPSAIASQLLIEDLEAMLQATHKTVETAQRIWVMAKTPMQKQTALEKINSVATSCPDPEIAQELRRIIGT
jgi:hypothetical protein